MVESAARGDAIACDVMIGIDSFAGFSVAFGVFGTISPRLWQLFLL